MRVTFLLPTVDLSGGNRVVASLALHLQHRGHRLTVVSTAAPRRPWGCRLRDAVCGRWGTPSHFDGLPLRHRRLPHPGPVTDTDLPDADVLVATWWRTAEWAARVGPGKGARLHLVQDWEVWDGRPERVEAVLRSPVPKVAVSEYLGRLLEKRFGRPPVAVIPNAVDAGTFAPASAGPPVGPTCVGWAYSARHDKGSDLCAEAFRLAAERVPGLRALVIGNERPAPGALPAGARFWYRARDQALASVYRRCRAWLFGSRREGFGLPLLEALACGVPTVATPAGAAPQLLAGGGGLLVPGDDPAAMADALLAVLAAEPAAWRKWSTAGRATAAGWTWEDAVARFERALSEVVGRRVAAG
jgi:glycosyltransferase involved in cell wall biosynthesis